MAFSDFFCPKRILNETTVAMLRNSNSFRDKKLGSTVPLNRARMWIVFLQMPGFRLARAGIW
jgi:hypothetical protein